MHKHKEIEKRLDIIMNVLESRMTNSFPDTPPADDADLAKRMTGAAEALEAVAAQLRLEAERLAGAS